MAAGFSVELQKCFSAEKLKFIVKMQVVCKYIIKRSVFVGGFFSFR